MRQFRVFKEGVLKNVSNVRVRVSGAWKIWSKLRVYHGGAWKDVYPYAAPLPPPAPPAPPSPPTPPPASLSVVCDPVSVTGRVIGAGTVVTSYVTASITGGTPPHTVAWEVASWSPNTSVPPIANTPTALTTTFSETDVPDDDVVTASFRVNVQDSLGVTAVGQVDAAFRRISLR